MAATLFYLLKYPEAMAKLRQELDGKFSSADEIRSGPKLASCVYLRACVDEALRMAPPGPGILPRTALQVSEFDCCWPPIVLSRSLPSLELAS